MVLIKTSANLRHGQGLSMKTPDRSARPFCSGHQPRPSRPARAPAGPRTRRCSRGGRHHRRGRLHGRDRACPTVPPGERSFSVRPRDPCFRGGRHDWPVCLCIRSRGCEVGPRGRRQWTTAARHPQLRRALETPPSSQPGPHTYVHLHGWLPCSTRQCLHLKTLGSSASEILPATGWRSRTTTSTIGRCGLL